MGGVEQFVVRDRRRKQWFSIDNRVIDKFGPVLGPSGIAVYVALVRYGNETQSAIVGVGRLVEQTGVGRTKAKQVIRQLERVGLILVNERRDERAQLAHEYVLLDVPADVPADWEDAEPVRLQNGELPDVEVAAGPIDPASAREPVPVSEASTSEPRPSLPTTSGQGEGSPDGFSAAAAASASPGRQATDPPVAPRPTPRSPGDRPPVATRPTPGRHATTLEKHSLEQHSEEEDPSTEKRLTTTEISRVVNDVGQHVRAGWTVAALIAAGLLDAAAWEQAKRSTIGRAMMGGAAW